MPGLYGNRYHSSAVWLLPIDILLSVDVFSLYCTLIDFEKVQTTKFHENPSALFFAQSLIKLPYPLCKELPSM